MNSLSTHRLRRHIRTILMMKRLKNLSFFNRNRSINTNYVDDSSTVRDVTQSSVSSWLAIGKSAKFSDINDSKELGSFLPESLLPNDVMALLRRATELKSDDFYVATLDTVIGTLHNHSGDLEFQKALAVHGIATILDTILSQRMSSSIICERCLRVICFVLNEETSRPKFSSSGFCYRLIKICQLHSVDAVLLLWGLRVIRQLTVDESLVSKFAVSGACELSAEILHQYRNKNDEIVEWACRVIHNLCYEDVNCCSKLADTGVCEIIVALLRPKPKYEDNPNSSCSYTGSHQKSSDGHSNFVEEWNLNIRRYHYVIMALGSLCRRHDGNKERLSWLGACEVIIDVANYFSTDDVALAESLAWAIGSLTYPLQDNQISLSNLGSCHLLRTILEKHQSSEKCVLECLRAIRNIGHCCDDVLNEIKKSGIPNVVMMILRQYSESKNVVQWSWFVIATLAQNKQIVVDLGGMGICKLAADLIFKYCTESDIVQWICVALSELNESDNINEQCCNEGLVMLILEAMNNLFSNVEVLEECCIALSSLLRPYDDNKVKLGGNSLSDTSKFYVKQQVVEGGNICELVMKIWTTYEKSESLIQESTKVLAILVQRPIPLNRLSTPSLSRSDSSESSTGKDVLFDDLVLEKLNTLITITIPTKLVHGNYVKTLPKLLGQYEANGIFIESTFIILSEFLNGADSKLKLTASIGGKSSIYKFLSSAICQHIDVVNICRLGCDILSVLTSESSNMPALIKSLNKAVNTTKDSQTNNSSDVMDGQNIEFLSLPVKSHDCANTLLFMLLRHYRFYQDPTNSNVLNFSIVDERDNDISQLSTETTNRHETVNQIRGKSENFESINLITPVLVLISDLCSRNSVLQGRFGNNDACVIILSTIKFHKYSKKIVMSGCTTLSSMASSAAVNLSTESSYSSEGISNSHRLYCNHVCDLLTELLKIYSQDQEVMYFLCISINSLCNLDINRRSLCQNGVCSILLQSISEYISGDGYVTEALSALGSLYEGAAYRTSENDIILRNQGYLNRIEDIEILQSVSKYYLHHAVICECICRLFAFLVSGPNSSIQNAFLKYGLVDTSIIILEKYSEEALDTTKFALLAIANISQDNEEISLHIESRNVCHLIVQILMKHYENDFIVEACCRAISSGLSIFSCEFGKLGACEIILEALSIHSLTDAVLEWVCRAIGVLASVKSNVIILCEYHAAEKIVETLQKHLYYDNSLLQLSRKVLFSKSNGSNTSTTDTSQYRTTILHTIHEKSTNLGPSTTSSSNTFLGSMTSGFSRLNIFSGTESVAKHNKSKTTSENAGHDSGYVLWGVIAIYYLLKGSECNAQYQQILFDNGICDILFKLILKYEENELIVLACCKAIVTLSKDNETISQRLGSVGICTQIVEILQIYPSSVKIARWGSQAIASLASIEANIVRLAAAGICETIPIAIQAHQNSGTVALYGCEVVYKITLNDPVGSGLGARLGSSGACEAIVSVLGKHTMLVPVMEMASKALGNLALVPGNASWFGPAGACDALVNIVSIHEKEAELVANCWEAISNLCSIDFNRTRLFNLNVADLLVKTLYLHKLHSRVVEQSGRLVGRLCEYRGSKSQLLGRFDEYCTYFLPNLPLQRESDLEKVSSAYENKSFDFPSSQSTLQLISKVIINSTGNRQSLYDAGIIEPLLQTLQVHFRTSKEVCYHVIKAISILVHGKESICERFLFGQLNACELIIAALDYHKDDLGICVVCCQAIRGLCSDNNLAVDYAKLSNILGSINSSSVTTAAFAEVVTGQNVSDDPTQISINTEKELSNDPFSIAEASNTINPSTDETVNSILSFVSNIQPANQCRIRNCEGCALISQVLKSHLHNSIEVNMVPSSSQFDQLITPLNYVNANISNYIDIFLEAVTCCVSKLCEGSKAGFVNREIFGEHGICEIFVDVLQFSYNRGSFELTYYVVMALAYLSTRNIQNVTRLGFTVLGEHLVSICTRYMSYAAANMEIDANSRVLVINGETSTQSTTSDGSNQNIYQDYLQSIMSVEKGNEYDLLMEYTAVLISNVCQDRVGQHRFGVAGMCKIAVVLLNKYEKSWAYSSLYTQVIAALGWQFAENQTRLGSHGACKILVSVLERHITSSNSSSSYLQYLGITGQVTGFAASFKKGQTNQKVMPVVSPSTIEPNSSIGKVTAGSYHDLEVFTINDPIGQAGNDKSATDDVTRDHSYKNDTTDLEEIGLKVFNDSHDDLTSLPHLEDAITDDVKQVPKQQVRKGRRSLFNAFKTHAEQNDSRGVNTSLSFPSARLQGNFNVDASLIHRPSLLIDGFSAVAALARNHEVNRSRLQASAIIDILTTFLTIDSNHENLSLAKICAKDAMDAVISEQSW